MTNKKPMSDVTTIEEIRALVEEQARQIDSLLHGLHQHRQGIERLPAGDSRVFEVIIPLALAAGSSCHSLLLLTENVGLSVRDAFGVARSITETATNAVFVMASGPELADRAQRHAAQRALRYSRQEWRIGSELIQPFGESESPKIEKKFVDLLSEFTSRKGRELNWISDSVEQRIDFIEANFSSKVGVSLRASFYMNYRESSEILHGSLYGILFFLGVTVASAENSKATVDTHRLTLLISSFFAMSALVEAVGTYANWSVATDFSKAALTKFKAIPEINKAYTSL